MTVFYADPVMIWARVIARVTVNDQGCWIFPGATTTRGYGHICVGRNGKHILTHRLAVIVRDGGIPDGMTVDHQCHDSAKCDPKTCPHRRCVNPAHLKVMTGAENTARQSESDLCAKRLHQMPPADGRGKRECRACKSAYMREYLKRRAAS